MFAGLACLSRTAFPAAAPAFEQTDRIFADFVADKHIPGLVYGIVADGHLVHVGTYGVQNLESKRPVTADTLFRIASMTKAFTALTLLKLRDEGLVRLDAHAEEYVPEMRGWKYPTDDSPKIRVRDLLNHVAGFVTDDPWGDRQTPLPEERFSELFRGGVSFTRAPETGYEYSNLGFALVGRIVSNVSTHNYAETITQTLLKPLGMQSSGFVAEAAPYERRALGYRWEDNAWRLEPTLGPGAFGAMGGLQTSADDYARWVSFLLSAWPARDGADAGPVRRATVRELAQGSNFPTIRERPGPDPGACRLVANYGMGMRTMLDCELGFTLSHSGGYPGYGSHVLLLPDRGVGIFAFASRTYAEAYEPVWKSAFALHNSGWLPPERAVPVSATLADAYRVVAEIYARGSVAQAKDQLAMNFLLDRDTGGRARDLAALKDRLGDCDTLAPISASGALSGDFLWNCTRGRLKGTLELAPTRPPRIQSLKLAVAEP
ncbi:MAG: beta-lactamase family protein [Proteobacteria bacterium]|nr:beta-lactamase family protein [Pseudomonadota bacterium]